MFHPTPLVSSAATSITLESFKTKVTVSDRTVELYQFELESRSDRRDLIINVVTGQ